MPNIPQSSSALFNAITTERNQDVLQPLLLGVLSGIDLEQLLNIKNNSGQTLLHSALDQENFPAVRILVEHIRRYNDKPLAAKALTLDDDQGNTPLHYAARTKKPFFSELLISLLQNSNGETPLDCWRSHQQFSTARQEALLQAIKVGDLNTVQSLADAGISFKIQYLAEKNHWI